MSTAFDLLLESLRRVDLPPDRPWITLAFAQSLDGSIAGPSGERLMLSSKESLELTHRLRTAHDAILVGVGTVLADDPRLTVRLAVGEQPRPIVLDPHLRTPPQAAVLRHPLAPWLIAAPDAAAENAGELRRVGATLLTAEADPAGRLELPALLRDLRRQGVRRVMVEGGAAILCAFTAAHLVDLVILTIAPLFVGGLRPWGDSDPGLRLPNPSWMQAGRDVLVWGSPAWGSV